MIGKVLFENVAGEYFSPHDYGIFLKNFTAPPPAPKVFRESIDGMDGELDFTEYVGEVRYKNREVNVGFFDPSGSEYIKMVNFIAGQKINLYYNNMADYYFSGRCEDIKVERKTPYVDLECSFVCSPYMFSRYIRTIAETVSVTKTISLQSARMSVTPSVTVSSAMTLAYDGKTIALDAAGTYTLPEIIITKTPKNLTVTGSGTITINWRDGVI